MMSIPHILHFVTSDQPDGLTRERLAAIVSLHPDWQIFHWTDRVLFDGGRLSHYYDRANCGAQRADLIRIDAIYMHGGIYIDSDFVIHRPLTELADHFEFLIGSEDGDFPTNAAFGAAPQHPALDAVIRHLLEQEPDWTLPANRTTGPHLFKAICQWRSDIETVPRETFYPYGCQETPRAPHRKSWGTHLWEGSWLEGQSTPTALPDGAHKSFRFAQKAQIELAKFLSTIGLKSVGGEIWDRVHDNRGVKKAKTTDTGLSDTGKNGFSTYTVGQDVFVQTKHNTTLICDGRDLSITPHLALRGFYEWAEESFIVRNLAGGDWFLDVGANIGNHSILAATCVGPMGRVFAFEPNQHCATLMRKSAVVNWVHDRLRVIEKGVSDVIGEVTFVVSESRLGDARIVQAEDSNSCVEATLAAIGGSDTMTISTTTLDEMFPVDLPIKMLKIDAEGHEPAILRGGARLFAKRAIDYILLEAIVEQSVERWRDYITAFETLIGYGYAAARLSPDGFLIKLPTLREVLAHGISRTIVFYVPGPPE